MSSTSIEKKPKGTAVHVGIHPSKVGIIGLKLDKDHKKIPERKATSQQVGKKGKCRKSPWDREESSGGGRRAVMG